MTFRLGLLGAMCGFLCACSKTPEPYAPPDQRPVIKALPPEAVRILNMADPDAESHFVRDIDSALQSKTWRWTGKRPTIRLHPNANQKLAYSIDFFIAESTFQQTGPVTLSFYVNDHLLDRVRYTSQGRRRFDKPFPEQWLAPGADVTLAAEIDKLWTPPQPGGAPLGFILVALGLQQQDLEPQGLEPK